jgi:hypothetical protein
MTTMMIYRILRIKVRWEEVMSQQIMLMILLGIKIQIYRIWFKG